MFDFVGWTGSGGSMTYERIVALEQMYERWLSPPQEVPAPPQSEAKRG